MLNFIENLNRIECITRQIKLDIDAGDYQGAKEHLDEIHVFAAAAQILLEQLPFPEKRSYPVDEVHGL